ncbi:hypothetical protein BV22DRAFT_638140 [Leucogyrophana mollusca]|uniref:Uncharacterized protein n=1 Tax=Leucogyrophana mollusca TaxID=85980 RepID=A0ACB8BBP1_9AGAM|nr:hypothetical protein BV22DRAFT_638140 [Leucogyrophana mollusca]
MLKLLDHEESFLKTLFLVSNVEITNEGSLGATTPERSFIASMPLQGKSHHCCFHRSHAHVLCSASEHELSIRVCPASQNKCPCCWMNTRTDEHELCPRRDDAVAGDHFSYIHYIYLNH